MKNQMSKVEDLLQRLELLKAARGWGEHPQPMSRHVQQEGNETSHTSPSEEDVDAYWEKDKELRRVGKRAVAPEGIEIEGKPTLTSFDYTNALPEHLQRAGYRLAVQHTIDHGEKYYNSNGTIDEWMDFYGKPENHTVNAVVTLGNFKTRNHEIVAHSIGHIRKEKDGTVTVEPHTAATAEAHSGYGLGYMTIRTVLAHAVNHLGATHMVNGYSSAAGIKMRSRLGDEYKTVVQEPQEPIPKERQLEFPVSYAPETSHKDLSRGFEAGRDGSRAVPVRTVAMGGRTALVKVEQLLSALRSTKAKS
jgi:hypothetical protein